MSKVKWFVGLALAGLVAMAPSARAQARPYIGFVYPAGGQQGTTFQVKLGGQSMEEVNAVLVSGSGVAGKVVQYDRVFGPQDITLISEQLRELRKIKPSNEATEKLIARIEKRIREYVNRPACASLSSILYAEVTIAPDAAPGERELRIVTPRGGASNPLVFHIGQVPEICRKPMRTAEYQVLGKEYLALRKRPTEEVEDRITIPCTVNGQIASGEANRYRFTARKGQRLVISTQARHLIPYLADAVPGWFQPVLALYDANGKEVAYDDDYQFKPDPMIVYQVPKDGEYVFAITDSIYRGREDFVYRITIAETPFISSIFPLGGRVGEPVSIKMKGFNLDATELTPPTKDSGPGIQLLATTRNGFVSNRVPFALDTLPETFDKEPNDTPARAQKVTLPVIVNGRIDKADDWDVYQFTGKAGDKVVAEVHARRLDSPLDSVIKLTDAKGKLIAFSDDREDLGAGVNTHHADSYFMAKLPADGNYFVHIGDTARDGGEEYAYRLRISAPQPDFALRVVPSSVSMRGKNNTAVTVYAVRKDGFTGTIKFGLKDPPPGFASLSGYTLTGSNTISRIAFKTDLTETSGAINLAIEGSAKIGDKEIAHQAVPSEDRMQAFLWRHLVPAQDFKVLAFNPAYEPPPKRVARPISPEIEAKAKAAVAEMQAKNQKFTKNQVAGRVRQLKLLFDEGLFTDDFYNEKLAECQAEQ